MGMIAGLLDRVVLVVSIIAAGAVPSFMHQYRQQVNGRLEQAVNDLQPFVQIANQRHDGKLDQLIDHHLHSADVTFVREGQAIGDMVQSVQQLNAANQGLDGSLWHQGAYLMRHLDPQVASATWSVFEPAFALNAQSLVFALAVGGLVWLVVMFVVRLLLLIGRALSPSIQSAAR